jgi:hypothetical protein
MILLYMLMLYGAVLVILGGIYLVFYPPYDVIFLLIGSASLTIGIIAAHWVLRMIF